MNPLAVPAIEQSSVQVHRDPDRSKSNTFNNVLTLKHYGEVGVAPGVPELDVLVGPPGDSFLDQRDRGLGSVGVDVKELQ